MSTQNQQSMSSPEPFAKKVEEGKWMYFNEATVATGKSEKTLKRYIKKETLRWRRVGKQVNSPVQVWITPAFVSEMGVEADTKIDDLEIFDIDQQEPEPWNDTIVSEPVDSVQENPYERLIKTMVGEFTVQLDRQREEFFELRKELQEKDIQLRLLPDLQKQLEEREKNASFEASSLKKQNSELEAKVESLKLESSELKAKLESLDKKATWWKKWFLPRES
jgi:hypothetical protein